jgi:hypothetical protein
MPTLPCNKPIRLTMGTALTVPVATTSLRKNTVLDLAFLALLGGFAALTAALVVLCDRVKGGRP